jgi:hypothetical protein
MHKSSVIAAGAQTLIITNLILEFPLNVMLQWPQIGVDERTVND